MKKLLRSRPFLLAGGSLAAALALGASGASSGCVAAKEARIALENTLDPSTVQEFPWGRVECGEGQICSEVAVARVDVHSANEDGPVDITLQNKTLESVAVQVALETFNAKGERTDITGFHDVALAPRQQSVLTFWQDLDDGERLVIRLRARG